MATIDHKFERLRQFLGPEYRDQEADIKMLTTDAIQSEQEYPFEKVPEEMTNNELAVALRFLTDRIDEDYRRWQNGETHPVFADIDSATLPPAYLDPKDQAWAAAIMGEGARRYGAGT
jgi:hypothetical protein